MADGPREGIDSLHKELELAQVRERGEERLQVRGKVMTLPKVAEMLESAQDGESIENGDEAVVRAHMMEGQVGKVDQRLQGLRRLEPVPRDGQALETREGSEGVREEDICSMTVPGQCELSQLRELENGVRERGRGWDTAQREAANVGERSEFGRARHFPSLTQILRQTQMANVGDA